MCVEVCSFSAVQARALHFGRIQSAGLDHKSHNQTLPVDKWITLTKSISFFFTERHTSEEVTDSRGFW